MQSIFNKVSSWLSSLGKDTTHSDLEKFIIDNHPQSTGDIDRLEHEYNRARFTDMGRQEYFPVTR